MTKQVEHVPQLQRLLMLTGMEEPRERLALRYIIRQREAHPALLDEYGLDG